jgi:hypothetical protein
MKQESIKSIDFVLPQPQVRAIYMGTCRTSSVAVQEKKSDLYGSREILETGSIHKNIISAAFKTDVSRNSHGW